MKTGVTMHPALRIALACILLLSLSISYSHAAAYYVSTTGSDSNQGTQASPWKTIQKAANTASAGDTVYINAGTYSETVTLAKSGSAGSMITFSALGQAILRGNLYFNGKTYITVNGLTVSPPTAGIYQAITVDGQHAHQHAAINDHGPGNRIQQPSPLQRLRRPALPFASGDCHSSAGVPLLRLPMAQEGQKGPIRASSRLVAWVKPAVPHLRRYTRFI